MPSEPCRCGHSRTRGATAVRTIDRHGFQLGPMLDQRVAGGVRLGARERADRVDQQAAGTQSVGAGGRDGHLESREGGEVGSSRPPEQLGSPARRPDARARRVHQHPVERPVDRWVRAVLRHDEHGDAETFRGAPDEGRPLGADVRGDDSPGLADDARGMRRLAARCGADIEHPVARLGIECADDERRRLVLHREPALREATQSGRVPTVERARNPDGAAPAGARDRSRAAL